MKPAHPTSPDEISRALESEYQRLCDSYLPIRPKGSIWWSSRRITREDLTQGWKLHVAATTLSAGDIFRLIGPCLLRHQALFKAPMNLRELEKLNAGIGRGFGQAGKFITVYPPSTEAAVALARELDQLTNRQPSPLIAYDEVLRDGSCVYYRYGQHQSKLSVKVRGHLVPAVRRPDGRLVADRREPGAAVPRWLADPFRIGTPAPSASSSLLETRFGEFEALLQRGRGGVYRALDHSVQPPRLCILKEGRKHGETDWLGRDGIDRIQREAHFLKSISPLVRGIPRFITTFRADHCFYLVMEHVAGRSLQAVITSREAMSVRRTLSYCMHMARLLADLHATGWAWLDCKPGNFLCGKNQVLRAVDFEGACRIEDPNPLWLGTSGYLPPKRHEANLQADDLYALGASFAQLATRTAIPPDLFRASRPVRKLPKEFVQLTRSLLQSDPCQRPAARAVGHVLERLLSLSGDASAR